MIIPTNPSNLGAMNQRLVLGSIFQNEPISKAELARLLKLSKPSIADNVNKLLDMNIVKELEEYEDSKAVGRRPTMLSINKNHKYIVVIDFYYDKTVFNMLNLSGEIINEIVMTQTPHQDFDSWANMSIEAVKMLLNSISINSSMLAAIGISSPGIITDQNQIIAKSSMYGAFDPVSLHNKLIEEFNCPVYLKNATNASALGEAYIGDSKKYDNIIYISCGVGLGAGIIVNGKLYEGAKSGAGEIANFITPQTLSSNQTFEESICIEGFIEKINLNAPASTKKLIGSKEITLSLISEVANSGDSFVLACIEEIGMNLGVVICNLVMCLNPSLVIFGGEYKIFSSKLVPIIQRMIDRYCIIPSTVLASTLEERGNSLGMSVFCRNLYFDSICGVSRITN